MGCGVPSPGELMDAGAKSCPNCPVCGGADVDRIGRLPDTNLFAGRFLDSTLTGGCLYRCKNCHIRFRFPIEDAEIYAALYDNQDTLAWPADPERPDWDRVIRYVTEHRTEGSVLDFGCYTGGLLARFGAAYERYGVEVNRAAAMEASNNTNRRVFASAEEIPEQQRFDVITACDVVEHMTNPAQLIGKLVSLLSDDGILIVTTGDGDNPLWNRFGANWWYCYYPEHLTFISKAWLDHVCGDLGASILYWEKFRYCSLSGVSRPFHVGLTYLYGWFPSVYLTLRRRFDKLRNRQGTTSVTGVGVSDDHLFVVLGKSVREQG